MAIVYIPVVGTFTYRDGEGAPAAGEKITFVPVSAAIVDGAVVTLPKKLICTLNATGEVPAGFELPTVGDGVYYSVREKFPGGRDDYTIEVLTTDTKIDLATIAPVVPVDPLASYAAATVTQGKHAVPIMAGAIRPSVTGGCAAVAAVAIAANQPDINTLDFDATTEEYAQFAIPMPKSWNEGTITAQFRWSHAATTTNFGVVWGIQAVAVSDDDTMAAAFGTAQTVTDTGGTTNDLYITSETAAITIAGTPQAGDTVYFRVYRKSADASDTMAIDARLHSVVLFLTTDADTDA